MRDTEIGCFCGFSFFRRRTRKAKEIGEKQASRGELRRIEFLRSLYSMTSTCFISVCFVTIVFQSVL